MTNTEGLFSADRLFVFISGILQIKRAGDGRHAVGILTSKDTARIQQPYSKDRKLTDREESSKT